MYVPLTAGNSCSLPACFTLRLGQPLPLCVDLAKKIAQVTELECGDLTTAAPMLGLIAKHASGALSVDTRRGLFVVSFEGFVCVNIVDYIV